MAEEREIIATRVWVEDGRVHLVLDDGSSHAFPVKYYPRLMQATASQLNAVSLRVGGRALRWNELDEDIWVSDAVCQNYPRSRDIAVAESPAPYKS